MLECKLISSLTKVFADQDPAAENLPISILRGETASCQVVMRDYTWVSVKASAPGFRVTVREVVQVPVRRASNPDVDDDDYLNCKKPGMYPDLLRPMEDGEKRVLVNWWKAFWIDAEPEENTPSGEYTLTVQVSAENGESFTGQQTIHFVDCQLPEQKLLHTRWFHTDCLADYYHVEAWSEEHWRIVENFVRSAVRMGVNVILTPIFTPALDTQVGGERTTVQLVDVAVEKGSYRFGFEKLERWVKMCKNCGITHFEMAHLYSQWNSNRTPKIMATVDGEYKRIFGWETEGTSPEYREFLATFLPALMAELHRLGVADHCRFHITDEPGRHFLDTYLQEKAQVEPYIEGLPIMDALSEFEFYQAGAVEHPAVASDSDDVPKFLEAGVEDLWLYYCCGQGKDVSNIFMAMPSHRTRILGVQLYLYKIAGFLQWGFNFYNSCLSKRHIDPFAVTDADEAFQSGDAFIVYPGDGGEAWESIRYMALRQGLQDMRAMELLESMADRETVEKLIMEGLEEPLTLKQFPRFNSYLPGLRQRINQEIEKRL